LTTVEALSLLIDRRQGGDGSRFVEIRNRLVTMLKLEESWIYEMGREKGRDEGFNKGRDEGRRALIQQLQE
jgi:flagellar biosynthesis/type III secretory pathway protein FliH